jgi:hypothetical protein
MAMLTVSGVAYASPLFTCPNLVPKLGQFSLEETQRCLMPSISQELGMRLCNAGSRRRAEGNLTWY